MRRNERSRRQKNSQYGVRKGNKEWRTMSNENRSKRKRSESREEQRELKRKKKNC